MRVINDKTKEYYDIPIAFGTLPAQRTAIADYAHVLAGEYEYQDEEKFKWTRVVLYVIKAGEIDPTGDMMGYRKRQKKNTFTIYKINPETFEEEGILQSMDL